MGHDKTSHERAEGDADVERGGLDGGSKYERAWMALACDAHEHRDARDREAIHEQRNKEDGHERKCAIRLAEPERKKGERECEQHRRMGFMPARTSTTPEIRSDTMQMMPKTSQDKA